MGLNEPYTVFVARVAAIVARYELLGPLPTVFEVGGTEIETGAIVRAKMLRIDSRGIAPIDPVTGQPIIGTTAKEVVPVGATDDEVHAHMVSFAESLYLHEMREWLKRDGALVDDPHADVASQPGQP